MQCIPAIVVLLLINLAVGEPLGEYFLGREPLPGCRGCPLLAAGGVTHQGDHPKIRIPQNAAMLRAISAYPQPPSPLPYQNIMLVSL